MEPPSLTVEAIRQMDDIVQSFFNFCKGLKKSFSGEDYLRDINQCVKCGKPSFFSSCLKCETDDAYRGWGSTGKL